MQQTQTRMKSLLLQPRSSCLLNALNLKLQHMSLLDNANDITQQPFRDVSAAK
jgi:hypothetical protein